MIEIKNILELDKKQKDNIYKLFKDYNKNSSIDNLKEYIRHCESSHFNNGNDYFVLVKEGLVKAVAGLITKPIKISGDAYITNISCNKKDKEYLDYLLKYIKNKTKELPEHTLKVGFNVDDSHIEEVLMKNGGRNPYEILEMKYLGSKKLDNLKVNNDVNFQSLNKENQEDYIFAHNESFKNSPNGSTIEKEDMGEIYENYEKYKFYNTAIALYKNKVIGFYEILEEDNIGEIESIGVIPEYQGKGYGLQILKRTVDTLEKQNVNKIKLIVVSTNKSALQMYKNYGFKVDKIYKKWYELEY